MEVIITKITDGKMTRPAYLQIKEFIAKNEGKHIEINLKKARSKRSDQQNKYMWGVVIPYLQDGFKNIGYQLSKDEVHQFIKSKFNLIEIVNEQTGDTVQVPLSTTQLTKTEFGEYLEKIFQFSAEFLGVVIPSAGEQLEFF